MTKNTVIQIRITEEEKGRWQGAARKVNATLAEWIRHVCATVVEGDGVEKIVPDVGKAKRLEVAKQALEGKPVEVTSSEGMVHVARAERCKHGRVQAQCGRCKDGW